MKLSEKGLDKLYGLDLEMALGFQVSFETLVFKPEDFTGAVTLTVDEAKLMLEALLRLPVEGNKLILKKTLIPLKGRIEQAEKNNE